MLKIKKLVVGQLQTNCYVVFDNLIKKALIIDPGDDADYIARSISDLELEPEAIVATHGHFDHILAATELKLNYKIPFLIHKADEFLLKRMRSSAKHFAGIKADPPPKVDRYLQDKEKLVIGHLSFDIMHTPGHTPGSISLYARDHKALFVGDTLFAQGAVGRTDFSYSDKDELGRSINKLLAKGGGAAIYPGHGDKTKNSDVQKYLKLV